MKAKNTQKVGFDLDTADYAAFKEKLKQEKTTLAKFLRSKVQEFINS